VALENGVILVDTKYEFGKTADGIIMQIDEVVFSDLCFLLYSVAFYMLPNQGAKFYEVSVLCISINMVAIQLMYCFIWFKLLDHVFGLLETVSTENVFYNVIFCRCSHG
jgi:hypothetical protein